MKPSNLLAGASTLITVTSALAIGQNHHGVHRKIHDKRDTVTILDVVTSTAAEKVTVIHDQFGNVLATHFPVVPEMNEALNPELADAAVNVAPDPTITSVVAVETAVNVAVPVPSPKPAPSPEPSPAPAPAAAAVPAGDGLISSGRGISWNPWVGTEGAATCKTQEQINAEVAELRHFSYIRLYSTECQQIAKILEAGWDRKLILGVWNLDEGFNEDLRRITSTVTGSKQGWSQIMAVTIGNEDHVRGDHASAPGKVIDRLSAARGVLRAAGYTGPVAHVENEAGFAVPGGIDTCLQSDFVALNAHAFFDPNSSAENAGQAVQNAVNRIKKHCGGKQVIVMESGWPHSGTANGLAIPSPEEQGKAIRSLKSTFQTDIVLFSSHDDAWKRDFSGSYGAEKFWGILGMGEA
ncbi:glycoside hydrolase [Eremomyces bilateralis CBS 781.70]|uniref:Glycoside hydrolase n=1 Tax=Eremomyces bilateralis CBS 781.70 TaxID=1392243 RepID=A0A6G1FZM2_9PEZI|nr:glycoside hydrolase [Eremomyces bilateralis CBS 781.70]KAF1811172.1 glycoside hydrolase [Eremomyces bilateralis CBS 781.70]